MDGSRWGPFFPILAGLQNLRDLKSALVLLAEATAERTPGLTTPQRRALADLATRAQAIHPDMSAAAGSAGEHH